MCSPFHHFKILPAIVEPISRLVVDNFSRVQWTTKDLLHDFTVFPHLSVTNFPYPITFMDVASTSGCLQNDRWVTVQLLSPPVFPAQTFPNWPIRTAFDTAHFGVRQSLECQRIAVASPARVMCGAQSMSVNRTVAAFNRTSLSHAPYSTTPLSHLQEAA